MTKTFVPELDHKTTQEPTPRIFSPQKDKLTFAQATRKHLVIQAKEGMEGDDLRKILKNIVSPKKLGINIESINTKTPNKMVIHLDSEESRTKIEEAIKKKITETETNIVLKEPPKLNPRVIIFNVPED